MGYRPIDYKLLEKASRRVEVAIVENDRRRNIELSYRYGDGKIKKVYLSSIKISGD